jgi:hypothetical protein
MDKLKIKSEIQEAFEDTSISNSERESLCKKITIINKITMFLSSDACIFTFTFIPTFLFIVYSFLAFNPTTASNISIGLTIIHLFLYKTLIKKFLLKDSKKIHEEAVYIDQVIKEINDNKRN